MAGATDRSREDGASVGLRRADLNSDRVNFGNERKQPRDRVVGIRDRLGSEQLPPAVERQVLFPRMKIPGTPLHLQLPGNATYLQPLASTAANRPNAQCLSDKVTKPAMEHAVNAPGDRDCRLVHRTSISRALGSDGLPVSKCDPGLDVLRKLLPKTLAVAVSFVLEGHCDADAVIMRIYSSASTALPR